MEDGSLGVSEDINNILWRKASNKMVQVTDGIYTSPLEAVSAAYTCKIGDMVVLAVGGLPTLPLLTGVPAGVQGAFSAIQPPPSPGAAVRINNNTASSINVATNTGASINGAGAGVVYALASHVTATFVLDNTGTNWAVV